MTKINFIFFNHLRTNFHNTKRSPLKWNPLTMPCSKKFCNARLRFQTMKSVSEIGEHGCQRKVRFLTSSQHEDKHHPLFPAALFGASLLLTKLLAARATPALLARVLYLGSAMDLSAWMLLLQIFTTGIAVDAAIANCQIRSVFQSPPARRRYQRRSSNRGER